MNKKKLTLLSVLVLTLLTVLAWSAPASLGTGPPDGIIRYTYTYYYQDPFGVPYNPSKAEFVAPSWCYIWDNQEQEYQAASGEDCEEDYDAVLFDPYTIEEYYEEYGTEEGPELLELTSGDDVVYLWGPVGSCYITAKNDSEEHDYNDFDVVAHRPIAPEGCGYDVDLDLITWAELLQ